MVYLHGLIAWENFYLYHTYKNIKTNMVKVIASIRKCLLHLYVSDRPVTQSPAVLPKSYPTVQNQLYLQSIFDTYMYVDNVSQCLTSQMTRYTSMVCHTSTNGFFTSKSINIIILITSVSVLQVKWLITQAHSLSYMYNRFFLSKSINSRL